MMNDEPQKIKFIKVKPKFIAQVCPRCNGYKTLSYGKYPCDMCEQRGYLEIPCEEVKE